MVKQEKRQGREDRRMEGGGCANSSNSRVWAHITTQPDFGSATDPSFSLAAVFGTDGHHGQSIQPTSLQCHIININSSMHRTLQAIIGRGSYSIDDDGLR